MCLSPYLGPLLHPRYIFWLVKAGTWKIILEFWVPELFYTLAKFGLAKYAVLVCVLDNV